MLKNMNKQFITFALALALSLSSCANWFQPKIDMDNNTDNVSLATLLTPIKKITSLQTPEQIFASEAMYSGTICISWKPVPYANSYRLQKAIIMPDAEGKYQEISNEKEWEDLEWETIQDIYDSYTYNDIILTNPSSSNEEYNYRYYYRIMALLKEKKLESSYTNPYEFREDLSNPENSYTFFNSDKCAIGRLFAPASKVDATKGKSTNSITLTWQGVPDAVYYKIYRDTREDFTSAAFIANVRGNQTSYNMSVNSLDQGVEYYFKIVAENNLGNDSAHSSIAMGYALQNGAPKTPENVKIEDGLGTSKTELKVTWDKVDSTELSEITYSLYRTSSVDSVYTLIRKDIPSATNYWVDTTNLKTGVIYYYYVLSVGYTLNGGIRTGETIKSAFSESGPEGKSPAVGFLLSAPSSLECYDSEENTASQINLVWTPAVGSRLSEINPVMKDVAFTYNIYYSDDQFGTYAPLPGASGITGTPYGAAYLSAEVSKKNFYKISAVNKDGTESDLSIAAAPQPDAPENVEASKTKNLSTKYPDLWAPNVNDVYPVLVTWSAPSTQPTPAGYYVYRSTKPDSGFRKISDDIITDFEFLDSNPSSKAGVVYYYKVVSLNVLGQGKKGNDPLNDPFFEVGGGFRKSWGYGALTREQWFREYNKEIATSQAKLTLMHKPNDLDKVGNEKISANVPVNGVLGTLEYTAKVAGLGAEITMPYKNYADHYINNDKKMGPYYILNGNTDTTSNMSANGNMHETVRCYHYDPYSGMFQGMYPGYAVYDNLQIKSGAAGGGFYLVQTYELDYTSQNAKATIILKEDKVDWLVGEDIRN